MPFPTHTLETAPAEVMPTLRRLRAEFGGIPRAAARLASSPLLLNTFLRISAVFEECSLTTAEREVIILTIAFRNGCAVCVGMHSPRLAAAAGTEALTAVRENTELSDPRLQAVRLFTEQALDRSGGVAPEQLQDFLDAGFTSEQALEVVLGIGIYTMSTLANRLVEG